MHTSLRILFRIVVIAVAYIAASLSVGVLWALLLAVPIDAADLLHPGFAAAILIVGQFTALLALLPALAGIVYAERTGVRSIWFYGIGGALTGVLVTILLVLAAMYRSDDVLWSRIAGLAFLQATAGFAAGLVYWLIAGRRARL